jgi:hypothetical protein
MLIGTPFVASGINVSRAAITRSAQLVPSGPPIAPPYPDTKLPATISADTANSQPDLTTTVAPDAQPAPGTTVAVTTIMPPTTIGLSPLGKGLLALLGIGGVIAAVTLYRRRHDA